MAYDLEEQEQLATLKAIWKQYGNLVTWGVIVALVIYSAWTGWSNYQSKQSAQASQLYAELQKSLELKDDAKVQRAANDLKGRFPGTAYSSMGALIAAKSAFDSNHLDVAKNQLQWVLTSGNVGEYKSLAQIRLASLALDEKSYDEALRQLSGDFPIELQAEVLDKKGDVYFAQSKFAEAHSAYQTAMEKMTDKNPGRRLLQIKLDATEPEMTNVASK